MEEAKLVGGEDAAWAALGTVRAAVNKIRKGAEYSTGGKNFKDPITDEVVQILGGLSRFYGVFTACASDHQSLLELTFVRAYQAKAKP